MSPLAVSAIIVLGLLGFAAFWTLVVLLLARLAGWPGLQARYPDRDEEALLTLHLMAAHMGPVRMNAVLWLSACPSGLRVSIMRLFGPFSRPFLVPWGEIDAESKQGLGWRIAVLSLGRPKGGTLTVALSDWEQLKAAAGVAGRAWPD